MPYKAAKNGTRPIKEERELRERLSEYRNMWIMVYFDLPTETPEDKLNYTRFRKSMLKDGFTMHQFSIYKRFCVSFESATTHVQRTKQNLPPYGHVSILVITDKQFGLMQNFYNAHPAKPHETPDQIALF